MKRPATADSLADLDNLTDEDLEHLSEGVDAFFRQVWEVSRIEAALHGRQSRECPWEH